MDLHPDHPRRAGAPPAEPFSAGDSPGGAGVVETRVAAIALPPGGLRLERGGVLPELRVAYETYGTLAPDRGNAVFICHALTGDAHVAGRLGAPDGPLGWWDEMIGPGKGIDTDHYFVVCANILGGCKGTTGPSSVNPASGKPYGAGFPPFTVNDMVTVHRLLLDHLGIARLAAVVGGSLGGMQVLAWAIRHPESIDRAVCIASAASLSAQALAFDVVGREAITADPGWRGGDYYATGTSPAQGLAQARKIGHITYLSQDMMALKFGRGKHPRGGAAAPDPAAAFKTDFEVERYLAHQGRKLVERFDANSYLHITRAMDEFDLVEEYGALAGALAPIQAKLLVVALSKDWLFPPEQSAALAHALVRAGKRTAYCLLHAPQGHDAFLVDIERLAAVIRAFLPWVGARPPRRTAADPASPGRAREHAIIADMIRPGARVLDLGCGDGALLSLLAQRRGTAGMGVDIDIERILEVIDKGHDVIQADIDAGLAMIPDKAYDYAVLSATLQSVRRPRAVLRELLRVADEGIVSFPNFGRLGHRLRLALKGRLPKGGALPHEGDDTPHLHRFTLADFQALCREDGIQILQTVCIPEGLANRLLTALGRRNLGADRVIARIARRAPAKGTQ
ncbi:MAG TPA: homoserine O-acetyltransferase [Planctomycetota bacterium]|jgi:homoserine O-acetyltransferase|nr:homoserine O-acetyltransferase [Planctomycetota bacterium]OQC20459.1 MAG: Homoserine O-acetyltransferase [Planctomycetes bacterium ADurb.Bin069]HNR99069.1 homoserine O-acetyltransferase [Planctomycetota bacterium]HNU26238.1 homoserine O-acetyltransferase [Planctomycetota bacterium]HOE30787.1 homoserine O-acetyltransferase [Planctomycetota bacterium]